MKLKEKPFNVAIIVLYTSTSDSTEEDNFYDTPENVKSQEIIITLSLKVEREQESEKIGKYELGWCNERAGKWVLLVHTE